MLKPSLCGHSTRSQKALNIPLRKNIGPKIWLVFVLTQENAFSYRFLFKANRKSIGSFEKLVLGIFKITFRLRDRHIFM